MNNRRYGDSQDVENPMHCREYFPLPFGRGRVGDRYRNRCPPLHVSCMRTDFQRDVARILVFLMLVSKRLQRVHFLQLSAPFAQYMLVLDIEPFRNPIRYRLFQR